MPQVSGYEIVQPLGDGGMAAVFLAREAARDRMVALKLLTNEQLTGSEGRFEREAAILQSLSHPNIVQFYSYATADDGVPYISMEYVDGETLAARLQHGSIEVADSLAIIRQVVLALDAAWKLQIVHRDLKPANVMITSSGIAKLTDFGVAKRIAPDTTATYGFILGTPAYASPEHLQGAAVTYRSDMYSLGIMWYELLTGRVPFPAQNYAQLVEKHLRHELPPLTRKDVPAELVSLIQRLAEKNPYDRPSSYIALLEAMDLIADDLKVVRIPVAISVEESVPEAPVGGAGFARLRTQCFCCDSYYDTFDPDHRLCDATDCFSRRFLSRAERERDVCVSLLPECPVSYRDAILPDLQHGGHFFARSSESTTPSNVPTGTGLATVLPYERDHLADLGLQPGNPLLYRIPELANWSDFRRVYVLDMSTYAWSHTLKDARSWAILNVAIEQRLSALALYTAGNAGLSLGRLAYEFNRRRPKSEPKIDVHVLLDENVTDTMRVILQSWGCHTLTIDDAERRILDPPTIWRKIYPSREDEFVGSPRGAWHVTDGWDGVGLMIYRLIMAQVLRELDVNYVVVPLGTGSLFLGSYIGIRDARGRHNLPHLIGVVPAGENILQTWRHPEDVGRSGVDKSVMQKLVGRYSPLEPCIAWLDERRDHVDFVEVSNEMVRRAADQLWGMVAFEPSGAAAVAALRGQGTSPGLIDLARKIERPTHPKNRVFKSDSSVLVVTSGFGLLSRLEADFLEALPKAQLARRLG